MFGWGTSTAVTRSSGHSGKVGVATRGGHGFVLGGSSSWTTVKGGNDGAGEGEGDDGAGRGEGEGEGDDGAGAGEDDGGDEDLGAGGEGSEEVGRVDTPAKSSPPLRWGPLSHELIQAAPLLLARSSGLIVSWGGCILRA